MARNRGGWPRAPDNIKERYIMKFMKAYGNQTYALLRIVSGFLFFWHGT